MPRKNYESPLWTPEIKIEKGMLVSLWNYYCGFDEYRKRPPEVVGMYLGTGREAQFEFYKIAVVRDQCGRGGFTERYLTSDFFISPYRFKQDLPKGG
jgi:hypothetical protein